MEADGIAFACILLGGALQGAFPLPLKYVTDWKWENVWLVYSCFAMVLFPWMLTAYAIPNLGAVYAGVDGRALLLAGVFGLGWGMGHVFYGLGVGALGMALGPALILGLTTALGSLIPLAAQHRDRILSRAGILTIAGIAVMLAGITVCAFAGRERERAAQPAPAAGRRPSFRIGVLICVASGILSAAMNFGFAFGEPVIERARAAGHAGSQSTYPVLALLLTSGFMANAVYSLYLLRKHGTWRRFGSGQAARHGALAAVMAAMLYGGYVLYGAGITRLGPLGPTIGWPLFISGIIITANLVGMWTGEWNIAGRRATRIMLGGSAILVLAVGLLGAANAT